MSLRVALSVGGRVVTVGDRDGLSLRVTVAMGDKGRVSRRVAVAVADENRVSLWVTVGDRDGLALWVAVAMVTGLPSRQVTVAMATGKDTRK